MGIQTTGSEIAALGHLCPKTRWSRKSANLEAKALQVAVAMKENGTFMRTKRERTARGASSATPMAILNGIHSTQPPTVP